MASQFILPDTEVGRSRLNRSRSMSRMTRLPTLSAQTFEPAAEK